MLTYALSQVTRHAAISQHRLLSTQGMTTLSEFRTVLNNYRTQHFADELPMRFKKQVVVAACASEDANNSVRASGLNKVLQNMNLQIPKQNLKILFQEEGGAISAERML